MGASAQDSPPDAPEATGRAKPVSYSWITFSNVEYGLRLQPLAFAENGVCKRSQKAAQDRVRYWG